MRSFPAARLLFTFLLLGGLVSATPLRADFVDDAKAWHDHHTDLFEQAESLSAQGYPSAGYEQLVALADQDGGPLAAYAIGHTLRKSDPASSYRLLLRAQQAFPNEPAVNLQVAMAQQRHGEYARAVLNYRRVIDAGSSPQSSALLADCLIRLGDLKKSVPAWNAADHARNHAAIDSAIGEIYGPLAPSQRRGDLVAKIEAGDLNKLNDLILLDLAFDTTWWNASVYNEGLNADLKRAAEAWGRRDERYTELALYAKLARPAEKKSSDIQKALKSASLVIGPNATLPTNSRLARAVCELAVTAQLVTPAELWTSFQAELRSRLEKQDHDALHLLCWLAAANRNPELTELDRLGWEDWDDPTFAASYLVDLYREKKLTTAADSQLFAAIAISPDNTTLNNLRIALAGENVTKEMIAGAIKAEYRKLSVGESLRDSSMLNNLFFELGKRL